MNVAGNGTPHNLTVTGTTTITDPPIPPSILGGEITVDDGSTCTLGTLANFSNGQITGSYNIYDSDYLTTRRPTVLQFRSANIIENRGNLYFLGDDSYLRDQDSGLDALRNFAVNSGYFYREDAPPQSTVGNLTNNGSFYLEDYSSPARSSYTVNGSVTNNVDGIFQADGNAEIIVKANLVNHGTGTRGALYVYGARTAVPGDALIRVEKDLMNDGKIVVSGVTGHLARLEVLGAVTNTGEITLDGVGAVNVAGVLTMGAGGKIAMRGNTGSETFMMTAKRIDAAAGSAFGCRGTIFADLTEHGVFYPGASPGRVTINGNIVFDTTAELQIELGGTTPGTQYDQVVQQSTGTGGVTLGGKLDIAFVNGFESTVQNSDTFTILASDLALSGAFSNVANGNRLHVSNGSGSFRVNTNGNNVVLSGFQAAPLSLVSAASQKPHAGVSYDIPLPLTGAPGIECRRSLNPGDQTLFLIFSNAVVSGSAAVTSGPGTAGTPTPYQNGLLVPLTGVGNVQTITVTLSNVTDTLGQVLPSAAVSMRTLLGDTNGDGSVNTGDSIQTRNRSGQVVSTTNYRSDVNTDGTINGGDAIVVRANSGSGFPP